MVLHATLSTTSTKLYIMILNNEVANDTVNLTFLNYKTVAYIILFAVLTSHNKEAIKTIRYLNSKNAVQCSSLE